MTGKDFLNFKKPHFWCALLGCAVLGFAGVVSVLDKETVQPPAEETMTEEIQVEFEEEDEKPAKTDGQIIMERFKAMDWEDVKAQAKKVGEEGWEKGIVLLGELPEAGIRLYGYNDAEYQLRGVAVDHTSNVNYFDWVYMSSQHILPEMYWNGAENQLQITLNLYDGTGINAEELHVLVEHHTMTMEDFVLRSEDYLAEIEEELTGTGVAIGKYVDIKLGKTMMLKFEPVKTIDGVETVMKVHQAQIFLKPTKDGFTFELGDIGVEPEKRSAKVKVSETVEETYTEIQYVSKDGFSIWSPENMQPVNNFGHEGFNYKTEEGEELVNMIIVVEKEMKIDDDYLKEAAGNYKSSGAYKKVSVGKIQKLKAEAEDVTIKTIEVVHDGSADRFYAVKDKEHTLLITVTFSEEALEVMGAKVDHMIQSITFEKAAE